MITIANIIDYISVLIFPIIMVSILIGFGVYYILKKLKGNLKIKIPKTTFLEGEIINGQLKFKAKKTIESNSLYIKLAREKLVSHGRSSSWVEQSSNKVEIEGKRKYSQNFSNYFNFKIKIPINSYNDEDFYSQGYDGKIFFSKPQIRWVLKAIDDTKGIDLDTKVIITVNQDKNINYEETGINQIEKGNEIDKNLDKNDLEFQKELEEEENNVNRFHR